jgi:multisubunit Na+/H+ antiporter MnhC subunit
VAALYATGVYLLLERSLTRVLLGVIMLGNATNVLLLSTGGPRGGPPLVGRTPPGEMSDPLPQAMILTAIVITLGVAAFVLALIHRSWALDDEEEVNDDAEDLRVAAEHRRLDAETSVGADEERYDSGEDLDRPRPALTGVPEELP